LSRLFDTRWLAWAEVAGVLVGAAILYAWPTQSAWALLVALLPWSFRLTLGQLDYRPTRFDFPLVIFLLTALGGVWAAYDRRPAWTKFWLIVLAVLLYYAIANQPKANLWQVAGLLSGLGGVITVYFLLTHNWQSQPADLEFINRIGRRWMSIRPTLSWPALHPNAVGGMLAMLVGFSIVLAWWAGRERNGAALIYAGALGGLMSIGLLLTSSRAAWLAWWVAVSLALVWHFGRVMMGRLGLSRPWVISLIVLVGGGILLGLLVASPNSLLQLVDQLPGAASSVSRLELFQNTFALAGDFPFTGGGLGSFPGLYSRYMIVIPVFLFGYSHNLFLDVWLEQGVLGGLAFVFILLGGIGIAFGPDRAAAADSGLSGLQGATLVGLCVLSLHGLMDDALYSSPGVLLLFILTGMAVTLARPERLIFGRHGQVTQSRSLWSKWPWLVTGITVVLLVIVQGKAWLAAAYANWGAVQMARVELSDWSTGEWEADPPGPKLVPSENLFQEALLLDPGNRTAHHRLGLIAAQAADYETAIEQLRQAYKADPSHRGIRKVLGYAYVWVGQLTEALPLLVNLPEAAKEMNVYAQWWQDRGQTERSSWATQMAAKLVAYRAAESP
jgi:O-antigen ligase/polysaccharide polymerase Wzy-like membrane protein/tetratricopeptide repeat protein